MSEQFAPRKVAVVAGARPGSIGYAVAQSLEVAGYDVVSFGRNAEGLPGSLTRSLDIRDTDGVRDLLDSTLERFGRIDVLVSSAGVRSIVPNTELDLDEWRRVLDINVVGTFNLCHLAGERMRAFGGGRIVTVSSIAGQVGGTLVNGAYSASKAAIIGLTKALAKEFATDQVTVNCVAPGTIDTPFIDDYDDARRQQLEMLIPLGRMGTAEDVAATVMYLTSDAAGWITGATLDVNGGQVIR